MALRTLIVDDEPVARKVLREELEQIEDVALIGEAADGDSALAAIRDSSPDLVFLDLQMPGLGGFDVIRKLQPGERIPMIVIVTAWDQYAIQAFEAGAIDYLLKPIDADIKEFAYFLQDTITLKNWTFNLGVRVDKYNGLASALQAEPRLGVSYNWKPTSTVFRISYARTMETPFNENLVVGSNGCNDAVIIALQSTGAACQNNTPLSPGHRNEFHAGLSQAFGRYLVVDGEYIWKYTHKAFDFSILGNTPIFYPIEWLSSKIPGYAIRATVPNFHGLTAFVVMSSVAARFFGPQVAGIGAGPGGNNAFRIDHDERFNSTAHVQYQPWKTGPWLSFNWRYDSGLVAGPSPCAGCSGNGPNGTDTLVDASGLTPDQQFQAGLFCGPVFATPTTPISPDSTCPAKLYGSKFLHLPAPGTEDDDHNPPRIASRNLFDLGVGDDNLFHGDRHKWSARVTVVNLTNKEALYNFISTFSGTHYVTPRAVTGTIGFHF